MQKSLVFSSVVLGTFFGALNFSVSALACPNLQGNWSCKYSDGSTDTPVIQQQALASGGTLYTLKESSGNEVWPADGVSHAVNENGLVGSYSVSCVGDTAVQGVETLNQAQSGASVLLNFSYTLQNATTLVGSSNLTLTQNGQTQTRSISINCAHVN
jgi:hypothetical protein